MQAKIESLCRRLSLEELKQVVFAKWDKVPHATVTTINYTFDLHSISEKVKNNLLLYHSQVLIQSLPTKTRDLVNIALEQWRSACGELIEFHYVDKLDENQPGITIIAGDKLTEANGVTISSVTGTQYTQALICLPSIIKNPYDYKTITHEIGHALGLNHVHEIESIKQHLMTTDQGMGCSVMGYNSVLRSHSNNCTTEKYCDDQTYALYPGPTDEQICSAVYQFPAFSSAQYFYALFGGLLSGSLEPGLCSFLNNTEILNLNSTSAENISMAMSVLLHSYIQGTGFTPANILALCEFSVRNLHNADKADMIHFVKNVVSISSLLFYFYNLYGDEAALSKGIYLFAAIGGGFCGSQFGALLGEKTADLANSLVNNVSPLFKTGIEYTLEGFTAVSNKVSSFSNWFFKPSKIDTVSEDMHQAVEIMSIP